MIMREKSARDSGTGSGRETRRDESEAERKRNSERIPCSRPSLFSRLDINFAIINCEDIINSRLADGSSTGAAGRGRRGRGEEGKSL